jgi:hypothetical protein
MMNEKVYSLYYSWDMMNEEVYSLYYSWDMMNEKVYSLYYSWDDFFPSYLTIDSNFPLKIVFWKLLDMVRTGKKLPFWKEM